MITIPVSTVASLNCSRKKPDELENLYYCAYKFPDDPIEAERLKKAGYDGAIHIGNGETATFLEFRVFNSRQVRSALSGRRYALARGTCKRVFF